MGPSIKANHGATVPDTSACQEQMSQANWLKSRSIKTGDRVRLTKLSHMRYQHPDLDVVYNFMLGLYNGAFIFQPGTKLSRFRYGGS